MKPARRRRTLAVVPVQALEARINVTPLVDVVLVLLIIFMVMAPLAERALDVQLASTRNTRERADVTPTQVLVALDASGALRINAEPVARTDYGERLRTLLDGRAESDRVVFVVASQEASYATLVETIDRAKQAGATKVGLAVDAASKP